MKTPLLIIFVTLSGVLSSSAVDNIIAPNNIPWIDRAAVIDGILNDDVWGNVQSFTGFMNHFPNDEGVAEHQTEVKLYHDGTKLYISAVYHDAEERDNITSLKRDEEDSVFLSDCFAIMIDPFNKGDNGYLFAVNALGVQYDALISNVNNVNENWNTLWESQTSKKGTDKYYEIAIPLDAINFNNDNANWGIQLIVNDTKINQYSTLEHTPRNFPFHDLRYTMSIEIANLPNTVSNKYSLQPAITANTSKDVINDLTDELVQLSLNGQYNITPSLRMDLTVNPDFSQVEVDQQVTNLTRFAINFPERRKFFLENSDLFANLGTGSVDPFNTRQIGASNDVGYGVKLSGNVNDKTRIGLLHSKTKNDGDIRGKDYTVGAARYNISKALNSTAYLVNTQESSYFNRVSGLNVNYRSPDNKWTGAGQYGKSFTKNISGQSNFFNGEVSYNTAPFNWFLQYQKIQENYIAESGFIPQQFNYDAATDQTVREGFSRFNSGFQIRKFFKDHEKMDWIRRFWISNDAIFNQDGSLRTNTTFISPFAIRFKDRSYTYVSVLTVVDNLNVSFDFLQNENLITPDRYIQTYGRVGYWSPTNKKTYINARLEYGQFYNGTRLNPELRLSYRMLPKAVLSASYEIQAIDLKELGKRTFHLGRVTSEIYFNNRLNWTTYLQYNTQRDNFNINSRIQWEYRPLSYVYLVFTNNYNNDFENKNWGISLKVNRRLDF